MVKYPCSQDSNKDFEIRATPRMARRRDGVKGPKNGTNVVAASVVVAKPVKKRQMFPAVCATCGKDTMVPFQPSGEKPVYCRECFVPPSRSNW